MLKIESYFRGKRNQSDSILMVVTLLTY